MNISIFKKDFKNSNINLFNSINNYIFKSKYPKGLLISKLKNKELGFNEKEKELISIKNESNNQLLIIKKQIDNLKIECMNKIEKIKRRL